MNWKPLLECKEEVFFRSTVFRFPAKYPFEDIVDFMIIEEASAPCGLKLVCVTGYHAGQTETIFPEQAGHGRCVSVDWLQANWQKWVYSGCRVEDVTYIDHYPSNYGESA